jgi:HPt (histidine-containing phosphotransfer) domain-containing protein
MNSYISKPIQVDELIAALEQTPSRSPAPTVAVPATVAPPNEHERALALRAMTNLSSYNAVDPTVLAEICEVLGADGEVMVRDLIMLFLHNSPILLDQLRTALAAGEVETVRRTVHTFRSPAAQMGALHLAALCQSLEAKSEQGDLSDGPVLLDGIHAEYIHVRDYFVKKYSLTNPTVN